MSKSIHGQDKISNELFTHWHLCSGSYALKSDKVKHIYLVAATMVFSMKKQIICIHVISLQESDMKVF